MERRGQIWDVSGAGVGAITDTLSLGYDGERGVKEDP